MELTLLDVIYLNKLFSLGCKIIHNLFSSGCKNLHVDVKEPYFL